ncbi:hypothetical protein NDU88_000125 [Pleurodeles waltl]|uniref:Retrotransposon gag domain-containing protein n=1 Tax=Pleurodeles waltl TaxID=8319 RepID=A0AAV7UQE4_PLEWA|nr:hypothetical protein NDU88_000125 [Pleurodeles waltl]
MVFRTLPPIPVQDQGDGEVDVFKEALMRLEKRFKPTASLALNRFKFYTRVQHAEETFDEFLTALRGLSVHCNFGNMTDEMIRDQIIVHVKSRKIQEHLWVMGDPKLQDVIATAKALEQSEQRLRTVQDTDKVKCLESEVVGAMVGSNLNSNAAVKHTTAGSIEENEWIRCDKEDLVLQEVKKYVREGWPSRRSVTVDVERIGRHPVSKLCLWWFKKKQSRDWEAVSVEKVRERVRRKQENFKKRYDDKWKVKEPSFEVGDWVKVHEPGFLVKGAAKFGEALKVIKMFRNSVVTQDGKVWNVRRLAKCAWNDKCQDRSYVINPLIRIGNGMQFCEDGCDHQVVVEDGSGEEESMQTCESDAVGDTYAASRVKSNYRARRQPTKFKDFV